LPGSTDDIFAGSLRFSGLGIVRLSEPSGGQRLSEHRLEQLGAGGYLDEDAAGTTTKGLDRRAPFAGADM
jgi:hypothetical protein